MSIQSEIDRLATVKAALKAAINGASGSTVGDVFGDYPGAITSGKAAIATAITEKGVATAADATFQQLAENVAAIESGGGSGTATVTINLVYNEPMEYPGVGVVYINKDGESTVARLTATEMTLTVMKNSFLLPSGASYLSASDVSGDLQVLEEFKLLSPNYYDTFLVYVTGDGTIKM